LGVDTRILNDSTRISRHVCHTLVYTSANHINVWFTHTPPFMHSCWWNDWICRGQSGTILRRKRSIRNVPAFLSQLSMKLRSSGAVCISLVPFIKLLYTTCVVVVWQLNSPLSMEVDRKSQLQRSLMAAVRDVLTARSAR